MYEITSVKENFPIHPHTHRHKYKHTFTYVQRFSERIIHMRYTDAVANEPASMCIQGHAYVTNRRENECEKQKGKMKNKNLKE